MSAPEPAIFENETVAVGSVGVVVSSFILCVPQV